MKTASPSRRSCRTAASSPTGTASRWPRTTGLHARNHAVEKLNDSLEDKRIATWPRSCRSTPATAAASKKLQEDSKNFEVCPPIRTRLTDDEVARFTADPLRFPGGKCAPGCSASTRSASTAAHVIGYIGRISTIQERSTTPSIYKNLDSDPDHDDPRLGCEQLQGHRRHRQYRRRAELRDRAARPDRFRRSGSDGGRPAGAHDVAHEATARQQPRAVARYRLAAGRRGDRRRRRCVGRDRTGHRRRARVRVGAELRSELVRRRHRPADLGRPQQLAGPSAAEPPLHRHPPGLDLQAVHGARRADAA